MSTERTAQSSRSTSTSRWIGILITRYSPLILVLALGSALRAYRLGARSLWIDEVITAQYQQAASAGDVLHQSNRFWDTMPLPALLTWATRGWGQGEAAIRAPYTVAGILTIFAIYHLGTALFRPRVGLSAAYLAAILPFSVWHGQEARPYTLVMLTATAQILFAYRAALRGRGHDWLALTFTTIVGLYTHYLNLVPTAAAAIFLIMRLLHDRQQITEGRSTLTQWRMAQMSAAAVLLAYAPWSARLLYFVAAGQGGTGRLHTQQVFIPTGIRALLAAYDFTGLLLACLIVGLLAVLARSPRRQSAANLLLGLWFAAPLVLLTITLHATILSFSGWARYLCFLYPAALIICALGAEEIAKRGALALNLILRSLARPRQRHTTGRELALRAIPLVLFTLMLVISWQIAPMLARSYAQPKDDYRAATSHVVTASAPNSVILLLGDCPDWMVGTGLQYYLARREAEITLLSEDQQRAMLMAELARHNGQVWGAISSYPACHSQERIAAIQTTTSLEVHTFAGIILFRAHDQQGSIEQRADALLAGSTVAEPASRRTPVLLP